VSGELYTEEAKNGELCSRNFAVGVGLDQQTKKTRVFRQL